MPTVRKTFHDGEILTAADLNGACNPSTADHIPYAVAAGTAAVGASYTTVALPPGRFTAPPVVVATSDDVAHGYVLVRDVTTTTFRAACSAQPGTISWIAIQMDA